MKALSGLQMTDRAEPTRQAAVAAPSSSSLRPADVGLDDEQARELYRLMVLTRALDERMWTLNRQGKAPFVTPARGHEALQVASARALRIGVDWVVTYYRDWGVALALGLTPYDCLLSLLGKADDPFSGGRQLPGHFSAPALRLLSPSSAVATQIPHAVGLALAARLRREPAVAIVYFGDGATSEGDFHEAANFAGIYRLPVVFVCENNRYAISVPTTRQMPTATVAERAVAYGFPGVRVDGNDPLAVYGATRAALARARAGDGPTLLEAETYRLLPHSSDDDDRTYRDPAEVAAWEAREPLRRYRARLTDLGLWSDADDAALWAEAQARVAAEAAAAEAAPDPPPGDLLTHLYAEPGAPVVEPGGPTSARG
ncbi:MAG TPA: thiamine pyrophosphate-dependent dehydrogenase E1 component subunit alpha [Chloroflexota bacterium]|nr:thiamine pyrophosphate-dependent dehydrogenase E1 component subunit alpha [Chloroflexota bacterium]